MDGNHNSFGPQILKDTQTVISYILTEEFGVILAQETYGKYPPEPGDIWRCYF